MKSVEYIEAIAYMYLRKQNIDHVDGENTPAKRLLKMQPYEDPKYVHGTQAWNMGLIVYYLHV